MGRLEETGGDSWTCFPFVIDSSALGCRKDKVWSSLYLYLSLASSSPAYPDTLQCTVTCHLQAAGWTRLWSILFWPGERRVPVAGEERETSHDCHPPCAGVLVILAYFSRKHPHHHHHCQGHHRH